MYVYIRLTVFSVKSCDISFETYLYPHNVSKNYVITVKYVVAQNVIVLIFKELILLHLLFATMIINCTPFLKYCANGTSLPTVNILNQK